MMEKEELEETITTAISNALDTKLGSFFVERETHYQHHQFIKGWMELTEKVSSTAISAVVKTVVGAALILILFGVAFWGSKQFTPGG